MIFDQVEVSLDGILSIRSISPDGTYHRYTLPPGHSLDGQPQEVVEAAQEAWTPAILSAWQEKTSPSPPTNEDVNAERGRRIAAVSLLEAGDYGPVPVSGDPTTQLNLLALKDTARDLKAAGVTGAVIPFRDAENVSHLLTADQVIALVDAGKERVQAVYSASWAIKSMAPPPADVTDDSLWP